LRVRARFSFEKRAGGIEAAPKRDLTVIRI